MLSKNDDDREFWQAALLAAIPPFISALPDLLRLALGKDDPSDDDDDEEDEEDDEVQTSFRHFVKAKKRSKP
jgi:hypothetical protein